jgi:hypothetical protein
VNSEKIRNTTDSEITMKLQIYRRGDSSNNTNIRNKNSTDNETQTNMGG